jgi:hypothetical protein
VAETTASPTNERVATNIANATAEGIEAALATPSELMDHSWVHSILRPTLIAIASVCLVLAMLAFIRRFMPSLPPVYTQLLAFIGVLASITGSVTTTWLAQPSQRNKRSTGYRAAEIFLIIGVTRIAIWLTTDSFPGFEQFLVRPIDSFLDGYFIVGTLVVMLAWIISTAMTEDLLALGLQPDDLYVVQGVGDRWQERARPVYTDRPAILRRFVARWVVGGILLVILAAGSRYDLPESGFLGIIRQNIDPTVIGAIIVYFLAGLILISQGQLALLRARWALQKTPSAPNVLQNWPVYALVIILLIGIVSALLPLGGTFYLAQILSAILYAIYFFIFGVFRFFMTLMLTLLSFFTGEPVEETAPPPPPPMPAPPMEVPPESAALLPPWAGGLVFWGIAAILLGYAAYIYFSGKGTNFAWARRIWEMLRARWRLLFGAYQTWQAERVRAQANREGNASEQTGGGLPGWLGLRGLDPERQVRYYYLALLQRAEEAGLPRKEAETPLHFAPRLAAQLEAKHAINGTIDDHTEDVPGEVNASGNKVIADQAVLQANRAAIEELTEAFVQVRYAGGKVAPDRLAKLKQVWDQLKKRLQL